MKTQTLSFGDAKCKQWSAKPPSALREASMWPANGCPARTGLLATRPDRSGVIGTTPSPRKGGRNTYEIDRLLFLAVSHFSTFVHCGGRGLLWPMLLLRMQLVACTVAAPRAVSVRVVVAAAGRHKAHTVPQGRQRCVGASAAAAAQAAGAPKARVQRGTVQ